MGGGILRLLHGSWVAIDRCMVAPVIGDRPPSAKELSAEVQCYSMSNQHTFGDEYADAWSEIDDERDELQAQGGQPREATIAWRSSVSIVAILPCVGGVPGHVHRTGLTGKTWSASALL